MDQSQWQILQMMLQQRNAARQGGAGIPGMAGTPGGPVQESPTMGAMRGMQSIGGAAALPAGLALGAAGAASANLPAWVGGGALMAAGDSAIRNAGEPNIRDVWADQLRMKMQGR